MEFINYPAVCSLAEAERIADEFDSVVSLVPSGAKKLLLHRRRCLIPFDDVSIASDPSAATLGDIHKILKFAADPTRSMLVHCQYGQSRSTAAALGILVSWGVDARVAYAHLAENHPPGRPFIPNVLVLSLFDQVLGLSGDLVEAGSAWCDTW